MFSRYLRPGVSLIVAMTVLLGIVYPLAITGISQTRDCTRKPRAACCTGAIL